MDRTVRLVRDRVEYQAADVHFGGRGAADFESIFGRRLSAPGPWWRFRVRPTGRKKMLAAMTAPLPMAAG
ncbi:hypothetical protein MAUB_59140 [Mycolicibacterium aubagnense]|uniref:Uncharacterized protein n=1 Tax=Mycolicibacterium aubagnense TaxID=319707 RepID=A0ABN5Z4B0_9MYCO|nr:hypothetical protein MAUB_59140 [Mycolicibacterium aubagnense]